MSKQRINISGWSEEEEQALQVVYEDLKKQGLTMNRDGKPNVSAILLYLLKREASEIQKRNSKS